jgi:hypothetical protein
MQLLRNWRRSSTSETSATGASSRRAARWVRRSKPASGAVSSKPLASSAARRSGSVTEPGVFGGAGTRRVLIGGRGLYPATTPLAK